MVRGSEGLDRGDDARVAAVVKLDGKVIGETPVRHPCHTRRQDETRRPHLTHDIPNPEP